MISSFLRRRRTQRNNDSALSTALLQHVRDGDATEDNIYIDPPKFTLRSLMAATGNLAARNKLGVREGEQERREGVLGPVFKGKLADGQVVAVRRLPASHWQTFQFDELKDALVLASKLKHDNIVQLLAVCLERREKLLVYKYLPNASLDTILFNTERRRHLDWEKRYRIIRGIARGLLYLHKESGLRINLKGILRPSKVLLDDDMSPKILDAGIVRPKYTEGEPMFWPLSISLYAAPEWTMTCKTSRKSDMFSFGVILLEVVTGRGMYYDWRNGKPSISGLTYVWDNWKAGSIADIADPSLGHHYSRNEMHNCVQIGLLCLHWDKKLRPDALTVMQALDTSWPTSLPNPSGPYGSYRLPSMP